MKRVASVGSKIYDHFHGSSLCQQHCFAPASEDAYVAYYNSMYLLQDSTESLDKNPMKLMMEILAHSSCRGSGAAYRWRYQGYLTVAAHKTQCDSCAFHVVEDQSTLESDTAIDNKYKVLRGLPNAPKKLRSVTMGFGVEGVNKTETCFISSPLWPSKVGGTCCPDRVDNFLSLESALSLRSASAANRIALDAKIWAIISAIIATIAIVIAAFIQK